MTSLTERGEVLVISVAVLTILGVVFGDFRHLLCICFKARSGRLEDKDGLISFFSDVFDRQSGTYRLVQTARLVVLSPYLADCSGECPYLKSCHKNRF
jgi:hypothetical protein